MHDANYLIGRQPVLDRNEGIRANLSLSREGVLEARVKAYGWRSGMF
ncbi:hypothetical protein [Oryzomonas sagensis]|nr:hypothetical protein [Oryzomonas sagensis]